MSGGWGFLGPDVFFVDFCCYCEYWDLCPWNLIVQLVDRWGHVGFWLIGAASAEFHHSTGHFATSGRGASSWWQLFESEISLTELVDMDMQTYPQTTSKVLERLQRAVASNSWEASEKEERFMTLLDGAWNALSEGKIIGPSTCGTSNIWQKLLCLAVHVSRNCFIERSNSYQTSTPCCYCGNDWWRRTGYPN